MPRSISWSGPYLDGWSTADLIQKSSSTLPVPGAGEAGRFLNRPTSGSPGLTQAAGGWAAGKLHRRSLRCGRYQRLASLIERPVVEILEIIFEHARRKPLDGNPLHARSFDYSELNVTRVHRGTVSGLESGSLRRAVGERDLGSPDDRLRLR